MCIKLCVLVFILATTSLKSINATEESHKNLNSSADSSADFEYVEDNSENVPESVFDGEEKNTATSGNDSDERSKNTTDKHVLCTPSELATEVRMVNDTDLANALIPTVNSTQKFIRAECIVVLFYSKYCPFSSMAAPHFNALPRAFPRIKMYAINAMMYHLFNAQNGIVGVPSIILFHNGRPVAKFNDSEYSLELFSRFITKHTGVKPKEKSYVTSADFSGPVFSVPSKERDMFVWLSWTFIAIAAAYYFSQSKYWEWVVETVLNIWRESEAQALHAHED